MVVGLGYCYTVFSRYECPCTMRGIVEWGKGMWWPEGYAWPNVYLAVSGSFVVDPAVRGGGVSAGCDTC